MASPSSRQDLGTPNVSSPTRITSLPPNQQALLSEPLTQQQENTTTQRKPGRPPGSKNKNYESGLKELKQNINKMVGDLRHASKVLGSMKTDLVPKFAEADKKIKQLEKEVKIRDEKIKVLREEVKQLDQKLKDLQDPISKSKTKITGLKSEGKERDNKIADVEPVERQEEQQNCVSDDDDGQDIEESEEASDASDSEIESLNETRVDHESETKRLEKAGIESKNAIEGLLRLVLGSWSAMQSSNIKPGTSGCRTESNKLAGDRGKKRKKSATSDDEIESN